MPFQRDIPVQLVKYYLKTKPGDYVRVATKPFNGEFHALLPESDKLMSTSLSNVPAFHREPDMPPDDAVRPWVLLYFAPYLYLDTINKYRYDSFASSTKLNDELRKTAIGAIAGAATLEQKIQRLFEFCRSNIKLIDPDASGLPSERAASHQKAAETLKTRSGTSEEINLLFAALATACGIDARLALGIDRSDIFLDPITVDPFVRLYFLRNHMIAIKIDGTWRFYDPGSISVPYWMLPWDKEAVGVVIVGRDSETYAGTPLSDSGKSSAKRTARLRLSEDGTLEGDIRMEYYGHFAAEEKENNRDDSPAEREKTLRELIKKRVTAAELSNIRVENASDSVQPFIYSFHVKVPGYAQRTGKRLFFQPAFFQYGTTPRFSAPTRKYPMYFHYPWQEEDDIEIELPAGFALDHAESIGSFDLADIGKYAVRIAISTDQQVLAYKRSMSFGLGGRIFFPAPAYESLKKILDTTHELDGRIITLKQGG